MADPGRRIWLPFLVAFVGTTAALILAAPIGRALGRPDDGTGAFALVVFAAIPIALVAAVVSGRWVGAFTLVLGFGVAGSVAGVFPGVVPSGDVVTDGIQSALIVALPMGVAGVPTYLMAVAGLWIVARSRRTTGREPAVDRPDDPVPDPGSGADDA